MSIHMSQVEIHNRETMIDIKGTEICWHLWKSPDVFILTPSKGDDFAGFLKPVARFETSKWAKQKQAEKWAPGPSRWKRVPGLAPVVDSQSLDFLSTSMCSQFKHTSTYSHTTGNIYSLYALLFRMSISTEKCWVFIFSIYLHRKGSLGSSLGWGERSRSNDFVGRDGCGQHWAGDQGWVRGGEGEGPGLVGFGKFCCLDDWSFKSVPHQADCLTKQWLLLNEGLRFVYQGWRYVKRIHKADHSNFGMFVAGKAGHWLCCRQICKSIGSSTGVLCFFSVGVAFCVLNPVL